jgi:hypothetical protein
MQVTISHVEDRRTVGLFRKALFYVVRTTVQFSPEELAAIRRGRLEKTIVVERPPHAQARRNVKPDLLATWHFDLTIGKLIKGIDDYPFETPLEAKRYDGELREALTLLKDYIDGNATPRRGSESFEL